MKIFISLNGKMNNLIMMSKLILYIIGKNIVFLKKKKNWNRGWEKIFFAFAIWSLKDCLTKTQNIY